MILEKRSAEEMGRMRPEDYNKSDKTPLILIVDQVRSLYNVGSLFRSADAFRIEHIYLCGITGTPPHKEIRKTALGSEQTVPWTYCEQTIEAVAAVKSKGYKVYALEQTHGSISLDHFDGPLPLAFVLGNEVHGVDPAVLEVCDGSVEIPQFGTKHSFNVSVSAAILMWHLYLNSK